MSYTQIYYHIVIRTKYSEKSISQQYAHELYRYIWGIIMNKKCRLFRINGIEDHIHLLVYLHPVVALSDFIKDVKLATNYWMKKHEGFRQFKGWGDGYAAFTCSYKDHKKIINYIINQQEHHRKESFQEEIVRICKEEGIAFDGNI